MLKTQFDFSSITEGYSLNMVSVIPLLLKQVTAHCEAEKHHPVRLIAASYAFVDMHGKRVTQHYICVEMAKGVKKSPTMAKWAKQNSLTKDNASIWTYTSPIEEEARNFAG